ncbi:MAG: polymer-forming cytoskeletal protein [Xanthomonadales bacterium]|nr:polymer-forming cytoskeletal protein [Xanthomonadales bacterium]
MFGNNKQAKQAKQTKASRQTNGQVDTLIGRNTHVDGNIEFTGGLYIDGKVTGSIQGGPDGQAMLSISEHGMVEGDIHVPHVVINGRLVGNIHDGQNVELLANAHVQGNIQYRLLQMAVGAAISGQLLQQSEDARQLAGPDQNESQDQELAAGMPAYESRT